MLKKLVSRVLSKELSLCPMQPQLSQPLNRNVRIIDSRMLVASGKNNFTPGYKENHFYLLWVCCICVWVQVLYIESFYLHTYKMCIWVPACACHPWCACRDQRAISSIGSHLLLCWGQGPLSYASLAGLWASGVGFLLSLPPVSPEAHWDYRYVLLLYFIWGDPTSGPHIQALSPQPLAMYFITKILWYHGLR